VSQEVIPLPGTREAKVLLQLFFSVAALSLVIYYSEFFPSLAPFVAYALPFLLVISLPIIISLHHAGNAAVPVSVFLLGMTLIVGGGLFDIATTLIHTPDLQQEGNPIARVLLDSGHSLSVVLAYGFATQLLYLFDLCALWLAFLRHRSILAESLRGFPSPLLFIKAATGGTGLTWRQWMLPLHYSELPRAYYLLWVMTVTLVVGIVDRWYLGLEWLELVPRVRWYVTIFAVVSGMVIYLTWLWYASRQRSAVVASGPLDRDGSAASL
jgi:hypothetical protein